MGEEYRFIKLFIMKFSPLLCILFNSILKLKTVVTFIIVFTHTLQTVWNSKIYFCIRPSPGRERIMDVVYGMDGGRNVRNKRGELGRLHTLGNDHHGHSTISQLYSNTLITIL
jgi:hypothetical protein